MFSSIRRADCFQAVELWSSCLSATEPVVCANECPANIIICKMAVIIGFEIKSMPQTRVAQQTQYVRVNAGTPERRLMPSQQKRWAAVSWAVQTGSCGSDCTHRFHPKLKLNNRCKISTIRVYTSGLPDSTWLTLQMQGYHCTFLSLLIAKHFIPPQIYQHSN